MKSILIYGDSNVWGDGDISGRRIPMQCQWPNILRKNLGYEYLIYQEGLPGRLAGNEEERMPYKNGINTFLATYRSLAPIDILIIALGSNDLIKFYKKTSEKIIKDLLKYTEIINEQFSDFKYKEKYFNSTLPRIIYILPSNFDYVFRGSDKFSELSEKNRLEIIEYFHKHKDEYEFIIYNDAKLFEDGVHFNLNDHQNIAKLVKKKILSID